MIMSATLLSEVRGQDEMNLLQQDETLLIQQQHSMTLGSSLGAFGYLGCYTYNGPWTYVPNWRSGTDRYHCAANLIPAGSSFVAHMGQQCKDMGGTRFMIQYYNADLAAGTGYNHCTCFTDVWDNNAIPATGSQVCNQPCDGPGATNQELCGVNPTSAGYNLNQVAGAFGDPHCVNSAGEWFDVHVVGRVPMVLLPPGARPEEADFAVVATATSPDGWDKCSATFISKVEVLANHNRDLLTIEPGVHESLEVKQNNATTAEFSLDAGTDEVMIKSHSLAVKIILNKVPMPETTPFMYLDMEVAGLQAAKAGGILGSDSHEFAVQQPEGCDSTIAKKRKAVRASVAKAV